MEGPKKITRRGFLEGVVGAAALYGVGAEKAVAGEKSKDNEGSDNLTGAAMELFGIKSPEEQEQEVFKFLDELRAIKPLHFRRYQEQVVDKYGKPNEYGAKIVDSAIENYLMNWWNIQLKNEHPFVEYKE